MPRVVPSQIDHYLSENFAQKFYNAAELQAKVGAIAGFLDLYRDMPHELITLSPSDYAILVAEIAAIELALDRYRGGRPYDELVPIGRALPAVWELIRKLPDRFPTTRHDLTFIGDVALRDMIGTDIDAVRVDLQSGEWKGATVLAGSCSEALLLYGIQERERKTPGTLLRRLVP